VPSLPLFAETFIIYYSLPLAKVIKIPKIERIAPIAIVRLKLVIKKGSITTR
jgi:hypothetical protein